MKKVFCIITLTWIALILLASCSFTDHHNHEFSEWSVEKAPTCDEQGWRVRKCSCEETERMPLAKLSHNFVGNSCKNCGKKLDDAGLYDENGQLLASWDELVNTYSIDVTADYASDDNNRPAALLKNVSELSEGKTIVISNAVKIIGEYAFGGTALENIVFEENSDLEAIEEGAFNYSNCVNIEIPSSVTRIESAFDGNEKCLFTKYGNGYYLGNEENPYVLLVKVDDAFECEIPSTNKIIYKDAFNQYTLVKRVSISEGVTSISDYAFSECTSLETVIIPTSLISIGEGAFLGCKSLSRIGGPEFDFELGTIHLGDISGLRSIGKEAFYGCSAIESVIIPASIESIGDYVFYLCTGLKYVKFNSNSQLKSIPSGAFGYCTSLVEIRIPDGVQSLGDCAFTHCSSLKEVVIPDGVQSLGDDAFNNCRAFNYIEIPGSVASFGSGLFYECTSLQTVIITDGVKAIGDSMFKNCIALEKINIADSVVSIGDNAFYACGDLEGVIIPDSIISIGDGAFYYCDRLTNVYYTGAEEKWSEIDIGLNNKELTVYPTLHFDFEVEN